MKKIQWNKVTWYSKLIAVIVFLAVFAWAFYLGEMYDQVSGIQTWNQAATDSITESTINSVVFACDSGKTVRAQFMQNTVGQGSVALQLSDGRSLVLPQAMSADGARYATPDGSFVFWDKGSGSFIEEGAPYATSGQQTTYSGCVEANQSK